MTRGGVITGERGVLERMKQMRMSTKPVIWVRMKQRKVERKVEVRRVRWRRGKWFLTKMSLVES